MESNVFKMEGVSNVFMKKDENPESKGLLGLPANESGVIVLTHGNDIHVVVEGTEEYIKENIPEYDRAYGLGDLMSAFKDKFKEKSIGQELHNVSNHIFGVVTSGNAAEFQSIVNKFRESGKPFNELEEFSSIREITGERDVWFNDMGDGILDTENIYTLTMYRVMGGYIENHVLGGKYRDEEVKFLSRQYKPLLADGFVVFLADESNFTIHVHRESSVGWTSDTTNSIEFTSADYFRIDSDNAELVHRVTINEVNFLEVGHDVADELGPIITGVVSISAYEAIRAKENETSPAIMEFLASDERFPPTMDHRMFVDFTAYRAAIENAVTTYHEEEFKKHRVN